MSDTPFLFCESVGGVTPVSCAQFCGFCPEGAAVVIGEKRATEWAAGRILVRDVRVPECHEAVGGRTATNNKK